VPAQSRFDAIVLAGGSARRLDGADKPALLVGESTLLDRVLAAAHGARCRVVVGPPRPTAEPVTWCREDPPGGGPLAALAAGAVHTASDTVLVLGADLPWLGPAVPLLRAALETNADADAALLIDADGHRNLLAAAWRRAALINRLQRIAPAAGQAMRTLTQGAVIIEVADPHGWGQDCDTWADVEAARRRHERQGR
jgi:molybdopterin-guanine dinucleotide biosynthesis protein A